jgi:sterol 14-demethylase
LCEEIRNNVQKEFATLYHQFSNGMSHLSVFLPHAPTTAHRLRDEARVKIANIFTPIIANRRKHPEIVHDDFLQVLIDATYTDDTVPTDDEIVGLLIAALFGGQHTSNITSTWMGLHMIKNKTTILPRLLAEQKEVLERHDGKMSLQALQEMDLLHRCMKETLRMYPPLVILMRTAMETVQYKGYTIPKGDIVAVCPPVSHRIPTIFANPDKWDPDRLAEPRNEDQVKYAFSAFGGGRHGCLGERFAFLQVKSIWSVLLRNFDFELCADLPEADYSTLVVGPKPPCFLRYKRKSDPYSISSF